jgi:hypothetical protein
MQLPGKVRGACAAKEAKSALSTAVLLGNEVARELLTRTDSVVG